MVVTLEVVVTLSGRIMDRSHSNTLPRMCIHQFFNWNESLFLPNLLILTPHSSNSYLSLAETDSLLTQGICDQILQPLTITSVRHAQRRTRTPHSPHSDVSPALPGIIL